MGGGGGGGETEDGTIYIISGQSCLMLPLLSPTIPTTHGAHLASHLKECSSAPRQPQGEVDGRIAATVVQAHLAPGRQKEENHLLRAEI